jgi:hypothetical protein
MFDPKYSPILKNCRTFSCRKESPAEKYKLLKYVLA